MASVTCAAYKAALALLERDMPPKHPAGVPLPGTAAHGDRAVSRP
jgi:hypothetical protein